MARGVVRRRFLLGLAALAPLPFLARRLHVRAAAAIDPRRLRALAAAVLPAELGEPGIERVTAGFERWLAGYREGVELVHGYGSGEIRRTGPSPALRWAGQLDALGEGFVARSVPERQARIRAAVAGTRLGGMPAIDRADHIALGLLAYFYGLPEATDLCYQAVIARQSCRPLEASPRAPLPLAKSG